MARIQDMKRIQDIKPKLIQRGMVDHKRVTIYLAPKYDSGMKGGHLSQLGFIGYMHELCNFSNGERTLAEIQRAMGHELTPLSIETLYELVSDLEELGYMTTVK
ncbi:MAG TPA: hypothetical protein VFD70_21345 [Anaerolineae bacterium]|nr:hypothetical protein [Anaerolineae bacterium]